MNIQTILIGAIAGAMGLSLVACGDSTKAVSGRVYTKPPAYVLASLDVGAQAMPEDDPRVSRYNAMLSEIRAKCSNPPNEISDVTIDVVMTLQRKGVQIDVYDLLQRINDAMPPLAEGKQYDFHQIASAFKVLGSS